jgi:hypothetical protein
MGKASIPSSLRTTSRRNEKPGDQTPAALHVGFETIDNVPNS